MSKVPTGNGGDMAVIVVLLKTLTFVAGTVPNRTCAPGSNPVPVIVIAVPPLPEIELGVILVIVGSGRKVKALGSVLACESELITCTSTTPAAWAGRTPARWVPRL